FGRRAFQIGADMRAAIGLIAPHKSGQRTLTLDEPASAPGVVDGCGDLAPTANDAGILQQPGHIAFVEFGHRLKVEAVECTTEVLALLKHGAPAQARLKT